MGPYCFCDLMGEDFVCGVSNQTSRCFRSAGLFPSLTQATGKPDSYGRTILLNVPSESPKMIPANKAFLHHFAWKFQEPIRALPSIGCSAPGLDTPSTKHAFLAIYSKHQTFLNWLQRDLAETRCTPQFFDRGTLICFKYSHKSCNCTFDKMG
jgi:hypothetical protein